MRLLSIFLIIAILFIQGCATTSNGVTYQPNLVGGAVGFKCGIYDNKEYLKKALDYYVETKKCLDREHLTWMNVHGYGRRPDTYAEIMAKTITEEDKAEIEKIINGEKL